MDIVDRMFQLVDEKYDEQRDFAKAVSVAPSVVSEWRRRKSSSYTKFLPTVANALDTTVQWLATGEGYKSRKDALSQQPEHTTTISADERQLLLAYYGATPELQAAVRRVLGID